MINQINIKENDIVTLSIIDQDYDGLGIAKLDDYLIFVKGAIVGEKVTAKIDKISKSFAFAHALTCLKKSDNRIDPKCKYFPKCGGCSLLHMKYPFTVHVKKNSFIVTMKKIAGLDVKDLIDEVIMMDYDKTKLDYDIKGFRNKIQMPVSSSNGKLIVGYYEKETHNVIDIDYCFSQSDNVNDLIKYIKNICRDLKISSYDEVTKKGIIRHILIRENYLNELMVVLIINEELKKDLIEILKNKIINKYHNVISIIMNYNYKKNNVILGDDYKVIFGKDEIIDCILNNKYKLSHKSFFQVNRTQTNKLYSKVIEYLKDGEEDINNINVIDGYCGVGSISLSIAKHVKHVYGIEVVKEAIDDAIVNAKINDIHNVSFYGDKVEDKINELIDKDIDCVVIDPPRKGVERSVIDSIINNRIKKVIYVSCNPATLARDLGVLKEFYDVKKISLVDMFCYSSGIETVCCLVKKRKQV